MLEPYEGKLSSTVLRGGERREAPWPTRAGDMTNSRQEGSSMTGQQQESAKASELKSLIESAVLAPSSHNTQPWCFALSGDTISLRADRSRALPANDPEDRELTISCGCALMNLRIAASHARKAYSVEVVPDPEDEDLLALVRTGTDGDVCTEEASLFAEIPQRRTYRKRFGPQTISDETLSQLSEAAQEENAWFEFVTTAENRALVADLVTKGDAVQWANPRWRKNPCNRSRGDPSRIVHVTE